MRVVLQYLFPSLYQTSADRHFHFYSKVRVSLAWAWHIHSFLSKNTIVATIYRSPSSFYADFSSELDPIITFLKSENKIIILLGDVHIGITDKNDRSCSDYTGCILRHGMDSLINMPTHCNAHGTNTIIIMFYQTPFDRNKRVSFTIITDHYPVFIFSRKRPQSKTEYSDKECIRHQWVHWQYMKHWLL